MARTGHRLRAVGADFLDTAPVRFAFTAVIAAPVEEVYRALAEDTASWARWFPLVSAAEPVPGGRVVVLAGGSRFQETVLVADRPSRYAYRADTVNRPGMRALAEDWRLEPVADGSLVRWSVAADPWPAARPLLALARPVLRSAFRRAMLRLDRRIAAGGGAARA